MIIDTLRASLADRYTIERELGAGGMATVYLAHDIKHERNVAVKVLRPELAAVIGAERFLAEIKTTANLQHPPILALFDSGQLDGIVFYVMPFVEGESLRDRLIREKQLPIDDALRIAGEVADALEYAHRDGVIHRDIKPENILLHGGHALVADFGIALAASKTGGTRMTETGMSLGTPHYMSPEQTMGERDLDARTDIYALGCVTYEMLVGDPPFTASTAQGIVARVMTEKPANIIGRRNRVPAYVEDAVLTALEKLPADRFVTAAAFASALANQSTTRTVPAMRRRAGAAGWHARLRDPLVLGLGALVIGLAATLLLLGRSPGRDADPFPVRIELVDQAVNGTAALSHDGHAVVFVGRSSAPGAGSMLYLRRPDQLVARPVPGTEGAATPVFSPDDKSVAFIANRRNLVKVSLDGGTAVPLAHIADNGGLDWSTRDDIVLGAGTLEGRQGFFRVRASGGALVPLTHVDTARKELSHEWPRVLADGKTVLFTIWNGTADQSELAAASLDDGKVVRLGIPGTRALGVVGGQLVYMRADGSAMAVPFDVHRLRPTGVAIPIPDSMRMLDAGGTGAVGAFLTDAGGLVFAHGAVQRHLVWVDHAGTAHPALADGREFTNLRIAPNGRQVAVTIVTGAKADIWIADLAAGTLTPLTTSGRTRNAAWSPDSRRILFTSKQGGRAALWWQPADGSGPAVKAGDPLHNPWNLDLSPDGHTAIFQALYNGSFNLESFSVDSAHEERELAASPTATEGEGRFSPDGHSVAYQSDVSGRAEVYVLPFPEGGGPVPISVAGAQRPIWGPDGKHIYYREGSKVISATLARDPSLRVVSQDTLFDGRYELDFDISNDGKQFLMIEAESVGPSLVVVPNWLTELRRLTAGRTP